MARKKKTKCGSCGAKNDAANRRCRICTTVINAEIPAAGAEPEIDEATEASRDIGAASAIHIPASTSTVGAEEGVGDPGGALSARLAASGQEEPSGAPGGDAPTGRDAVVGPPPEPGAGIEFDTGPARRPPPDTPPPPLNDETFDPDGLIIEDPRDTGPSSD
ncbi:MAG: hypothetical protein U5R31_01360 [Acidimicrobiia bacterium]|nr:hypothetical protein [Acidimicrobiia bacterium]